MESLGLLFYRDSHPCTRVSQRWPVVIPHIKPVVYFHFDMHTRFGAAVVSRYVSTATMDIHLKHGQRWILFIWALMWALLDTNHDCRRSAANLWTKNLFNSVMGGPNFWTLHHAHVLMFNELGVDHITITTMYWRLSFLTEAAEFNHLPAILLPGIPTWLRGTRPN